MSTSHNPSVLVSNALERAFARMSLLSETPTNFRIGDFKFSQKRGKPIIDIYRNKRYVGKLLSARFAPISSLEITDLQAILSILSDPKKAAIEHGKTSGCCACCGRALSDPASLLLGIGPICLANFGWGEFGDPSLDDLLDEEDEQEFSDFSDD